VLVAKLFTTGLTTGSLKALWACTIALDEVENRPLVMSRKSKSRNGPSDNPKNLNTVLEKIKEAWGIKISKDTIKRILKSLEMSWRRVRKVVGGQPDPIEYKAKKEALEELKRQDEQGEIDLRYLDESGFCGSSEFSMLNQ